MNKKLPSLALVSALVGALTLAGTGHSTTNPASCVLLEGGVIVSEARAAGDGCRRADGDNLSEGVHQHLHIWYRNRPDIKIEDLQGIETVDPGCSQGSTTVVVCPHRASISINGWGGRDFMRLGDGSGTSVAADGGGGVDTILGGRGQQRIFGGSRDDILKGRRGHDSLHGEEGEDLLNGGRGDDKCVGGKGDDRVRRCERGALPGDPPGVRAP